MVLVSPEQVDDVFRQAEEHIRLGMGTLLPYLSPGKLQQNRLQLTAQIEEGFEHIYKLSVLLEPPPVEIPAPWEVYRDERYPLVGVCDLVPVNLALATKLPVKQCVDLLYIWGDEVSGIAKLFRGRAYSPTTNLSILGAIQAVERYGSPTDNFVSAVEARRPINRHYAHFTDWLSRVADRTTFTPDRYYLKE